MGQGPQPDPSQQSQQHAQQQYQQQQQQYQQQQYQQYYQQQQQYPQQYYQQQYPQQPAPPRKRGRKRGVLIGIFATVIVLGLGGGGFWLWEEMDDEDPPPVDTSQDLAEAPMGCGMFTEDELRPLFPGSFATEGSESVGGDTDFDKSAQCAYTNTETYRDTGAPHVMLTVNTQLHKADTPGSYRAQSGVENAKEDLRRQPGGSIGVPNSTDDAFREMENSAGEVSSAQLFVQYRNVIVSLRYQNDALGEGQFTQPLMQLAELAIKKIDPQAGQQQAPSAAPTVPGIPGGTG